MGGYDKPLDDYKSKYIQDYKKNMVNLKNQLTRLTVVTLRKMQWIHTQDPTPYAEVGT